MKLLVVAGIEKNVSVQQAARRQLEMFLAGSILLALVTALNASLFLLARSPGRRREMGIRIAVGAPLMRLGCQLATEASLLVFASAGIGLFLSMWLNTLLRGLPLLREAQWKNIALLDWRVLVLSGLFLLILLLVVSLAPIVGLKRVGFAARETTSRATLTQRFTATAQIIVACALGAAGVSFAWHLLLVTFGYAGYEMADRYMIEVNAHPSRGRGDEAFIELARLRESIEAIPGVASVAFGHPVPGDGTTVSTVQVAHPEDGTKFTTASVGSLEREFIDLLGLTLLHGRAPEAGDTSGVAVNETFARALWGRTNVIGEVFPSSGISWGRSVEVVGVLADLSFDHPLAPVPPFVFARLGSPAANISNVVETQMTASELQAELTRLRMKGSLELQVNGVHPLKAMRDRLLVADRARSLLTIVTASVVVFLAGIGYYGTQRYLVAAGRREYAIHAALGAGPRTLGHLVIRRGIGMALPGLIIGAPIAFCVVVWLRDDYLSHKVSPFATTAVVLLCLLFVLLGGTLGPAGQAKGVRPAILLREQ